MLTHQVWCFVITACVGYDRFKLWMQIFFSDLDVGACIFQEDVPVEIFNISFECTQNKQQYGTKITCIEVRRKKLWLF